MKISTIVAALFMLLTGGNAAAFNNFIGFGDSLSDVGDNPSAVISVYKLLLDNCSPFHPCPPYEGGRISNGPVASEYLAESLFPGGVTSTNFRSYAVGGATSGTENTGNDRSLGILNLPGMKQEMDRYMSDSGGTADPDALYLVWGGGNDYFANSSPIQAAQNIGGYVSTLAQAGARNFLVPNLSDLGQTPFARMEGEEAQARDYTLVFNTELATQLGNVGTSFPSANIFEFDTYSFLNNIIQNPGNFGFADVTNPCISLPFDFSCSNPDAHLYWDDIHPTTRAHAFLGAAFATAVPEPATVLMFMLGLLVLTSVNMRQKASYAQRQAEARLSRWQGRGYYL